MTVNTFVMSGDVKRVEVNSKPTKKGPAAILLVQYGPTRQQTNQAVQFLNFAAIRVPPYVYEKCKDDLKEGVMVDIVGHVQGVLKQTSLAGDSYVTNELVTDRLQVVSGDLDEQPAEGEEAAG